MVFLKKKTVVEISKSCLRIVEGTRDGGMIEVLKLAESNLNEPIIKEDTKVDDILLQMELKDIVSKNGLYKKDVSVILSGISNILIREFEMPVLEEKQMYKAIRNEARQYFPINIDSYVFDYKQLQQSKEKNAVRQKVLVVGVYKLLIDGIKNAFKNASMNLTKIDIEPNSISKLFYTNFSQSKADGQTSFIIANVTRNGVSVSIVSKGHFVASKLFIIPEIELMFREENNSSFEIEFSVIEDLISDSIVKFYDFLRTKDDPINDISVIYLTGEICQHIDITGILKRRVPVEVVLADDFKIIKKNNNINKNTLFAYSTAISGLL